jgi:hypothetical protein
MSPHASSRTHAFNLRALPRDPCPAARLYTRRYGGGPYPRGDALAAHSSLPCVATCALTANQSIRHPVQCANPLAHHLPLCACLLLAYCGLSADLLSGM